MRLNGIPRGRGETCIRTVLLLELIILVACDPGMAVRQINSLVQSENVAVTAVPKISVDVKTTHQLIGENSYSPQSIATNTSDFLITITGVELVAEGTTFQNKPRVANYYPLNVPAHDTAALDVNFRFSDGVSKVFKNPGELAIQTNTPINNLADPDLDIQFALQVQMATRDFAPSEIERLKLLASNQTRVETACLTSRAS